MRCLKMEPYYFLNNSVKNEPMWKILVHKIRKKFDMSTFTCVHLICKMHPLYLENSKSHFSAHVVFNILSCNWRSALFCSLAVLDPRVGEVLTARNWIHFFLLVKNFHSGSPMNSQDDLVCAPNTMKQHNMHRGNIRARHISSLLRHGLNASTARW